MSIFDDNISNDLSKTEKIRCWFTDRVNEAFQMYSGDYEMYKNIYWYSNGAAISKIHGDLVYMWTVCFDSELKDMGVYSTRTDVVQKIGKNRFKVVINFCTIPEEEISMDVAHRDLYESVEIKDLKVDDLTKYFELC